MRYKQMYLLVCTSAQEETEQLERLQPDELALWRQQLEDCPYSALKLSYVSKLKYNIFISSWSSWPVGHFSLRNACGNILGIEILQLE